MLMDLQREELTFAKLLVGAVVLLECFNLFCSKRDYSNKVSVFYTA